MSNLNIFSQNVFENENIISAGVKVARCGSLGVSLGINIKEQSVIKVVKAGTLQNNECIVSGERVAVANGVVTPSIDGDYIVVSDDYMNFYNVLKTNKGSTLFKIVAEKAGDEVRVLKIGVNNDRLPIVMRANVNVKEGDKLKYDTDNLSLVKAESGDTAIFEAIHDAKQYDGVEVVLINEVIS